MIVVVGGHSRNIGKTAVMEGIARALPDLNWTAVKITQFGHGVCSSHGKNCDCSGGDDHPFALSEERVPNLTDSGRYLAAGASRSFWLRTKQGELAEGMPSLRRLIASAPNTLIESNSVLNFLRPDAYLFVLDHNVADIKDSARRFLERADALITLNASVPIPWPGVPKRWLTAKPRFAAEPPHYFPPACARWLRARPQAGVSDGQREGPSQK